MDDTLLPLSYEQRRLWLIDRLDPGSPAYNLPLPLRAEGPLDPAALAAALGEIARRHAVLRTTYSGGEGEPGQRVHPPGPFHLPLIDLSALPPGPRRRESQRLVGEDLLRPFDLEAGPLFRGSLVRLRDTEHLVLLGVHHIAFDGWSQEIFLGELAALYDAGAAGRPSPLPEPVWQYGDFAAWQQSRGAGEAFAAQLAYWRQALDGAPDVLEIPGDHPRPPQQGFRGGMVRATLPAGPTAALAALGRERGATLFMLMLAGFQALLQRWTGQDDFLVGTPVAGRDRAETQGLIGFFANTLALRADLTGDPGFAELLARVRETCLAAYSHKELPFELLVEELRPRRDPSRPPLVQVVLTTQTARREVPQPPGLRLLPLDTDFDVAKFDLTLRVAEADPVLALHLEYAADLFEAATLERMAGHLRRLLTGAAADPRARLSELPLLSAGEERQLLFDWSGTPPVAAADACLHELFEAQAARSPERTALIGPDGGRLSYRELDARASRLARRLRALGVGPETLVAVMLERTADLIVALYAVLKAGGAYVPIDPAYPRQRVLLLLESSRAAVLLTRRALLAELEQSLPAATAPLFLDPGWEELTAPEVETAPPLPGNLAYIIYTSGSTGTPKGVAIEHRSAVALARWAPSVYSAAELSCVLGSTSICFDMSVFEIFCTLAWGGTLAVAENALALPRHPAASEVTLIDTVPSAMAELVRAGEVPPLVRTVNLGGEALKGSLVAAIHERTAVEKVYNVYGPSEDTTFSTFALVPRGEAVPSIGRPLVGSRLYVLDAALRPVPAGVPGAVYLSGDGLSRGYLGRPDLTAERFIPDPYGPAGSRLYRVGDLARYRPDSELEFLGRIDHQVKVRGFRIELGEIEAALSHDLEVRECAVLALPEPGGEGVRLVAFVVPSAPRADLAASLRAGLKTRLPEYMVPTGFAFLDALPLTPNGKLDRRALERIAPETAAAPAGEAPRTPLERTLAGLFAQVLGVPAVGRDDDFFDLGGHSLMAVRLVAEIRQALGIDLVVRTVFDAPTVAALALALSAPRAESPAPLARAFTASRRAADRHPLSYSQRRLWFLDQLTPGSHVYNIAYPLRIEGPLAPAALAATLGEIVRRHEVLRTTYTPGEWDPGQVVRAPGPFPLPAVDLSALPEERRRAEALRLADEEAARPFDLEAGPVFRATLTRLSPAEHHLLLGVHHIAFDGWSVDLLLHELAALYEALAAGRPSPLPEPAWQYADFAAWQRSALTDEALAAELAFWRRALDGAPGSLELPADHPRPPQQSLRGRDLRRPLADATAAGLRALGRERRQTLFMVALAGFQALLGRYTGQKDLIVGSPVAGRTRPEVAGLVGFFVNTLALRADLAGDPSFDELLARVREACLAAYSHQDLPFETLVEELRPQRDPSRSPLVQVVLLVEALRRELPAPHGLRLTPLPFDNRSAKFDLTMGVGELDDGLVLNLEYATDLFEAATIERMAGHFETLLAGAVADPSARLSELPLLSAGEERQLLFDWSGTPPAAVADACLHELFEAQAARTPERTALIGPDGGRLSYRELDARASRLSRRLRALGVGPETLVAVMLERTADLIVALYAVLKAGGAYVPIDPAYPRQRVLLLLESSRAAVLLTRRALLAEFEQSLPAATAPLFLDPGWEEEPVLETGVGAPPLPGNLAYIIYTSGSTGTPKGVAIEHRSAVALARWARQAFSAAELSRVLGSTSVCFDMSVFEIFCTLAWGGTLAVAENALALPRHPAAHEVTLINTVPSAMAELVRAGEVPPSVRTAILGGEALKGSLVAAIHETTAVERVCNGYGPSEDTTFSTFAVVPRGEAVPSIGRPLAGSRLYVLDAALRPVPAGVPGAVYLSGDGLSRGYLGRPDLTAERFIPDPYGPAGSRLYRVGDLARYRPDSELEFLGRIDHQVKVRGFRIELGEIEAVLSREPGVRECAVLALPEPGGEGVRLVAFVVPAAPRGDLASSLRAALKARLPEYMVPTAFALLDALPLTPNGKLDRRALERLAPETAAAPAATAAPRTPVEEVLAGIWAEVFGRPVGVHDNFFDLGGHSLLAVRAVSRIRTALEVEIPLSRLFAAPTVAGLAVTVEAERRSRRGVPLPPVEPVPRDGDLPLSFAQQRLWLLHRVEPGSAAFNVPYPLRLTGQLDPPALARALAEMARRHEALRTVFAERAGHPYQVVLPAVPPPLPPLLPVADLGALPAARREEAALRAADAEARRPFDLARGPVLRAVLARLAAEEHVLLVTLHHVATDGLSMTVFARELLALYTAFAAGRPSPLPEPRLQYADFAVWQRRHLEGAGVAALVERFKERFGNELPVLRLPTDYPRPAVQTTAGAYRAALLPAELSAAARTLARRSGATLFMTLLAAFQSLLARYAGQERIVVGSPVAGRDRAEIEGVIGFFVNTIVLPADLGGDPTFAEALARVRGTALAAYALQDLPFEKLVEALQPEYDRSRTPLFQVMFALQSEPVAPPSGDAAGGLAVELFPASIGAAQFDLTLYMIEQAGGGLEAVVEYNTGLFKAATIDRLLGHYQALLAAAAARPETRLSELPPAAAELPRPAAVPVAHQAPPDADARRDRLSSRLSKLTAAQREALEKRLRGDVA